MTCSQNDAARCRACRWYGGRSTPFELPAYSTGFIRRNTPSAIPTLPQAKRTVAQPLVVHAEPLQADESRAVDDAALVDPAPHVLRRCHEHADVLMLIVEAVDAARCRRVGQPGV